MGNGHYVLGIFGRRDRGIHPAHQRPRWHLSGARWVRHDEHQSARCPRDDEDQIAIVMDDPGMMEWPVILGIPTLYRVMEVIKESEISKLAVP